MLMVKRWLSRVVLQISRHPYLIKKAAELVQPVEPSVVPSYMRYISDEILECVPQTEPPDHFDVQPIISIEPLMLDWEEDHSEDTPISQGLSILCDFAANDPALCSWLMETHILIPCQIMTQRKSLPIKEQQQIARLVALLANHHFKGKQFTEWLPWLRRNLSSPDLMLASHALRGWLHIRRGQNHEETNLPSYPDGVHFFNPSKFFQGAQISREPEDGTLFDVVFVHGIRGGPFLTWRIDGSPGSHNDVDSCWPSLWLSKDVPEARLMSVHFAAPVSSWEGGSDPLQQTALKILNDLKEAGIGERPVLFVAHSMGGIIVKELLTRAMDDSLHPKLVENAKGLVFISTPHHGVWLASLAWGLRHIGAYPAPSLNTMKPGPYLEELNERIWKWVEENDVPVINFAETLITDVSSMLPKLPVVSVASAFPGYGQCVSLEDRDHINSCKPRFQTDGFYQHFLRFLNDRMKNISQNG